MEVRNNFMGNAGNNYNRYNPAPIYHVIKVSGRNSVESIPMGPNSDALFLDESGTLIWYVETDGAGYKKVIAPYNITPHQDAPPVDLNDLLERVKHLEDTINARSNKSGSAKNNRNTTAATE